MSGMPASLDSLPFDLMHVIASSLNVHDYVHLSRVSRRYHSLLQNESMSRRILQTVLYTREGQKIRDHSPDGCFTTCQAIELIHNVRQSVASARPYSASLLAYGETFTYSEGILCYLDGPCVRVLNIHSSSKVEEVIDVLAIEQRLDSRSERSLLPYPNETRITSLSYSDRVLVCVCEAEIRDDYLLVIELGLRETRGRFSEKIKRRNPFRHHLSCTTKLFVRHNHSYLYYGTHSGLRPDGHHEWLVTGLDLNTGDLVASKPFRLTNFVGSDIGSTVCFRVHQGFLFAVSNQTSFEVEEVDWTSYYHCIKIPLGEEKPDLKARLIWQRQHGEGPINDSWTDLSLQKDEETNDLLIIESRKEWLGGGSANIRTYYTQPLRFDGVDELTHTCNFPANDPLTRTLDENSKPHFSEPRKRIRKHFHRECGQSNLPSSSRDFILAKTKFRAYNTSAMSFVDLVSDPAPFPGSLHKRDRLRLRIASRRQMSPLVADPQNPGHTLVRKRELDEAGIPLEGSEDVFHPTEVHLWPPDDAPRELLDVLSPDGRVGNIEAIADERSIIYATDLPNVTTTTTTTTTSSRHRHCRRRAIVMISFDPTWGHGLQKLVMPSATGCPQPSLGRTQEMKLALTLTQNTTSSSRPVSKRPSPSPPPPLRTTTSEETPTASAPHPKRQKTFEPRVQLPVGLVSPQQQQQQQQKQRLRLTWQEQAMYLTLSKGYRLR